VTSGTMQAWRSQAGWRGVPRHSVVSYPDSAAESRRTRSLPRICAYLTGAAPCCINTAPAVGLPLALRLHHAGAARRSLSLCSGRLRRF
jgi:hypothetical protein